MAGDPESTSGGGQGDTFTVVEVPEHLTNQVLEYVKALLNEESDTAGYMMAGISGAVGMGTLRADGGPYVGTGCGHKHTAKKGTDIYCTD